MLTLNGCEPSNLAVGLGTAGLSYVSLRHWLPATRRPVEANVIFVLSFPTFSPSCVKDRIGSCHDEAHSDLNVGFLKIGGLEVPVRSRTTSAKCKSAWGFGADRRDKSLKYRWRVGHSRTPIHMMRFGRTVRPPGSSDAGLSPTRSATHSRRLRGRCMSGPPRRPPPVIGPAAARHQVNRPVHEQ